MKEPKLKPSANTPVLEPGLRNLYLAGGIAALAAGVIFRRNLAVEIGMFSKQPKPVTVNDWFELLQNNRLLGLTYLHIFDIVNYAFIALMFLALYSLLGRDHRSSMAVAAVSAFLGITVYFSTNTAFSMLSLSDQYVTAATETQRTLLLSSGQMLLAAGRFTSPGAHAGSGGFISLLLVAAAGMITSIVMARSNVFKRITAYIGMAACGPDLIYCIAYPFASASVRETLAVFCIPFAGLLLMVWHILIGLKLYRLGHSVVRQKP